MVTQFNHLVFYDGECGLCDCIVQYLIKIDKHEQFCFAPLNGSTAKLYLHNLPPHLKGKDSLILIEDFKVDPKNYIQSKAVFRIFWLLGGGWSIIGSLFFLPPFLFDWGYRFIARHRHQFFPQNQCFIPPSSSKDRFLP